ncbi:hypothetical protein [Cellulomonas biazotea]|uniref:Uncharacterized protein n=1 Tax=Cellulomonas biazotea TaxID=1709 RepID=A0A402DUY3_9CELL|nr:hypothetical protein [Cellulomonas biazotea]GCE77886.1 hypothetical protein CBZ_29420 [Cellulomonas biazotea]
MTNFTFGSTETIAALALLASVTSLVLSWRNAHHTARITTYRSATDLTLDIDHVFVEKPELRQYFYGGVDAAGESADRQAQVEALAELMLDCFECIWDIRRTYSRVDRGSWGRFVLDMLGTSPVLSRMYGERSGQDWYPALDELMWAEANGKVDARTIQAVRWLRRLWGASTPDPAPEPAAADAAVSRPEPAAPPPADVRPGDRTGHGS